MATMVRVGTSYRIGTSLYIALTNKCNAGTTLMSSRGPGFRMPESSGFAPLAAEPTAKECASIINEHYNSHVNILGMGENDAGVAFAGLGEPLLRLPVLLETVTAVKESRHGIPFRVVTNGLFPTDVAAQLKDGGIDQVSVALMCNTPHQYEKIMRPPLGLGHQDVCNFVVALSEAGVDVECTMVKIPGVNVGETKKLAEALGALRFRAREFFP